MSAYVEAFDGIVSGPLAQYLSLSQQIGGDVQKHVSAPPPKTHLAISLQSEMLEPVLMSSKLDTAS